MMLYAYANIFLGTKENLRSCICKLYYIWVLNYQRITSFISFLSILSDLFSSIKKISGMFEIQT